MKTPKNLKHNIQPVNINPYNIHVSINFREAKRETLVICGEGYTKSTGGLTFKLTDTSTQKFLTVKNVHGSICEAGIVRPSVVAFLVSSRSSASIGTPIILTWRLISKEKFPWPEGCRFQGLVDGSLMPRGTCHYDLTIAVNSWNSDSTPKANVYFSWLCVAEGAFLPQVAM